MVKVDVFMPKATTEMEDDYVMTSAKLPDEEMYIEKFLPKVDETKAHHMLVYLCESAAGKPGTIWRGGTCAGGGEEMLVFAYAHGGKRFDMPEEIAYRASPKFKYIVVQMHYRVVVSNADTSGLAVHLTSAQPKMFAGMLVGMGMPSIPPQREKVVTKGHCDVRATSERMTIFAFRVHTHELGRRVAAWRVRGGKRTVIVDHDPQRGQYFTKIAHVDLMPGDTMEFQCEYNSMNKHHYVSVGSTHLDEMCNVYLMHYSALPGMLECAGNKLGPYGFPAALGAYTAAADLESSGALGQVTGATYSKEQDLFVFHRAGRKWSYDTFSGDTLANKYRQPINKDTVLIFDRHGRLKGSWGKGETWLPHGIAADPKGGIWITDVGAHHVAKFSEEGRRLVTLGQRLKPGDGHDRFCKPTDVAISVNDGAVFISDGYCNSRVVKFDAAGVFLAEFKGDFAVAHSIAIDTKDRLYLADRQNRRLVRFSKDGKKLDTLRTPDAGLLFGVALGTDCLSEPDRKTMRKGQLAVEVGDPLIYMATTDDGWKKGRVSVMLPSGHVIQQFGDADDKTEAGERLKDPHAIAVSPGCKSVVVPELSARIARFVLAADFRKAPTASEHWTQARVSWRRSPSGREEDQDSGEASQNYQEEDQDADVASQDYQEEKNSAHLLEQIVDKSEANPAKDGRFM